MSKNPTFDSEMVRTLAQILNETNLTEIEYKGAECKIRVVRQVFQAPLTTVTPAPMTPQQTPSASTESLTGQEESAPDFHKHPGALKAPMVGTAYMAPAPGSAPFVSVGSTVTKGQTLMIIEAMKVMNQIKAHRDGTLTQILCKEGDPVEYDQLLFVIE